MNLNGTVRASGGAASKVEVGAPRRILHSKVFFEYGGRTGLTVIGRVTGKRYRFNGPGSVAEVDLRDRSSLAAVPHLKQLR